MRYQEDEHGNIIKVAWVTYQDAVRKRAHNPENQDKIGQNMWINSQEYIDSTVKKYYNDAKAFANTLKTNFLTPADKESLALEGLYEAAGLFDPTKLGKNGRPMIFTSFLYRRIRQILFREIKFVKQSLRCVQVPYEDVENDIVRKQSKQEIQESTTGFYMEDGTKRTIFDSYIPPEAKSLFDIEELQKHLVNRLTTHQQQVLNCLLNEDMNQADIARELGVTRQAVNLHFLQIRRHIGEVLKKMVPHLKTNYEENKDGR